MEYGTQNLEQSSEDILRETARKKAEASLNIPDIDKRAHFDNFRRQLIDAKSKDLIPYVDETEVYVSEIHSGQSNVPSGNINKEGVKKPYAINTGTDPSAFSSVWEKFFGSEEALREATHEVTHATVLEQNGIKAEYVFYVTKTREGQNTIGPGVYFEFPKDMPEKQQAEIGIKAFSAVEDPSPGDLSQIEHYKSILEK